MSDRAQRHRYGHPNRNLQASESPTAVAEGTARFRLALHENDTIEPISAFCDGVGRRP